MQLEAAEAISDDLGNDHDLAVFRALLDEHTDELGAVADRSALLAMFRDSSSRLRTRSMSTGRRLFADTPATLEQRFQTILKTWQSDQLLANGAA